MEHSKWVDVLNRLCCSFHGSSDLGHTSAEMLLSALLATTMVQNQTFQPIYPVPTARQLAWHKMEYYAFVHFGPNTFSGNEWGSGKEDPKTFNPSRLDCRQWVKSFKAAGMSGVIITAKHHDGFCLWPSKYSTHTVASSLWKGGKGDVLRELSDACREEGLKMGVYLSPWDRNHPNYGTGKYNETFQNMLREVLTQYGPIFEVWFDGANGEGPNGKKQVYDWPAFHQVVRKYQPDACMFSDAGPDIRWVGNESGHSAPTCWSMITGDRYVPGTPLYAELTEGSKDGKDWIPAECDASIRPGWFWRESENDKVKTPSQLMDLYYRSVGQNANFLLNVPADTRGLIHESDVAALMGFKALRDKAFKRDLIPLGVRAKDGSLRFEWNRAVPLGCLVLQEGIAWGQRVEEFEIWAKIKGTWQKLFSGTTIGRKRIVRFDEVLCETVELRVTKTRGPVILESIQAYGAP